MINRRLWQVMLIALACFAGQAKAKIWYYDDAMSEEFYESVEEFCMAYVALQGAFDGYQYEFVRVGDIDTVNGYCFVRQTRSGFEQYFKKIYPGRILCDYPNASPKLTQPGRPSCPCNTGYEPDPLAGFHDNGPVCKASVPPEAPEDRSCRADGLFSGNPILPATAEKYRSETDWTDAGPSPLSLERTYRSNWARYITRPDTGLGAVWTHNHGARVSATPALAPTEVAIAMPEGSRRTFARPAGTSVWIANNHADHLEQGPGDTWTYRRADDDTRWTFDSAGKLQAKVQRNGWAVNYDYNAAGQLATIRNGFGRNLALAYNASGQLTSVTTPDARVIGYAHDDQGRLSSVSYPDGKTRSFLYENPAFPQALTGILDESGARWGSFSYDEQGRAIGTELAGAAERYQVSYPSAGTATVVDPLGTSRNYRYSTTKDKLAVAGSSLPSGTGGLDAASRVQDANGLITSETDFKGVKTTTTWDVARRLPIAVTRAVGTPEAKTITTQWHPVFSLPVLVTEAGRTTASTYDDKGNVLSQAITDTASSPNTTRTWQWTWNAQGLAATETEPNGAVTTFEYDPRGNLVKSTNALGHVTQHGFDSANRLIGTTDPAGLSTTYTWDARDRLLSKTVVGHGTTTLSYTATGLVDTLTSTRRADSRTPTGRWSGNGPTVPSVTKNRPLRRIGSPISASRHTRAPPIWPMSSSTSASWGCTVTWRAVLRRTGIGTSISARDATRSPIASGLVAGRTGIPMPTWIR